MTGADLLLLVGYPVAVVVLTRLRSVFREGRTRWFLAHEAGALAIALGWMIKDRPEGAAVNALWAAGVGAAWVVSRRRRRSGPEPPEPEASNARAAGGAPGPT